MAKINMTNSGSESPFHQGEQEIQSRFGVREKMEAQGRRFIRDFMPEQHQDFYNKLPFMLLGTVDKDGRPWASIVFGRPGFANAPDSRTLNLATRPVFGDPLNENLTTGLPVGVLGIEYQSRRRNRMATKVAEFGEGGIVLKVDQAFGNCPRYIQVREHELLPGIETLGENKSVHKLTTLDERAKEIINKADHFYIASHFSDDGSNIAQGADVSHRGGKPGFVRIDDERTLTFPDFNGNLHYNTLGNISINPRAGLLFIDFEKGDLLYLTCSAEIIWDSEERQAFTGAESLVRLVLDEGLIVEKAVPIKWTYGNQSPVLTETGSWQQVAEKIAARAQGNVYREYKVTRVEPESSNITSFYLEPKGGDRIPCHVPGQFLPIQISPESGKESIQRTYTISNAPNGRYYRLSIKRETAPGPDLPPGLSSNYFHDQVKVGATIRALSPRGGFTLDESSNRPIVLLSAGVGITPMISILEHLGVETSSCRNKRPVWFIHGARSSSEHAFAQNVNGHAQNMSFLRTHIAYSKPAAEDVQDTNYHSTGRVDIGLLKQLLPFDDYEFYLCGPAAFMTGLFESLKSLNVPDDRIHYEFFGPGAALQPKKPGTLVEDKYGEISPVAVRFDRSGIETTWNPAKGSLLDLAESEGLQPDYSCRSGICQTCATRVIEGEVAYSEPPMVEPEEGVALICSSHPLSSAKDRKSPLVLDL